MAIRENADASALVVFEIEDLRRLIARRLANVVVRRADVDFARLVDEPGFLSRDDERQFLRLEAVLVALVVLVLLGAGYL